MGLAALGQTLPAADNRATLVDLLPDFLTEIRSVLDLPADAERPPRAVIEDMLTSGYAHVLALEAERLRVERSLQEKLRSGALAGPFWADELGALTRQLEDAEHEVAHLRALLVTLRARTLSVQDY